MTGYDVSIAKTLNGVQATWLTAAPTNPTTPNKIRWSTIQNPPRQDVTTTDLYGVPGKFLNTDGSNIAFNCQQQIGRAHV